MAAEILKKITTKTVLPETFDPLAFIDAEQPTKLYTVMGVARAVKSDSTQYGTYYKLLGNFEARRLHDGAVFVSGACILPEPLGTMIGTQLLDLIADDKEGKTKPTAKFALVVSIKSRKGKKGVPYEWIASPLVDTAQVDPLADLRAAVAGALPSPTNIKDANEAKAVSKK